LTSDLERQARAFAQELTKTLNSTICQHARIQAVLRPMAGAGPMLFTLGHGLSKSNPAQPKPFPLSVDRKNPRAWMDLSFQVRLDDDEQKYLTVQSSYCGIFADEKLENCLCHFDYERDKEQYTSAHVQVHGTSPALKALKRDPDKKRPLDKLHIPVGGRRFRPSIEDIIEFLIVERIADAHDGWEQRIEDGRARFHMRQLRAAMRRNPEIVKEYLREMEQREGRR
jgi:hypothetical protein